jgi:hypothetical protein
MRRITMMPMRLCLPLILAALAASACSGSSNSSSTTAPTQTINNDTLVGTVPPPVNGVLQTSSNSFTVGQGGGTVSVTLTSATETLPSGAGLLANVTMGLAVGSSSISGCTALTNAYTTAQPGASPQLSGSLSAGTYCVIVSDVTNQLGPVAYAVSVAHP